MGHPKKVVSKKWKKNVRKNEDDLTERWKFGTHTPSLDRSEWFGTYISHRFLTLQTPVFLQSEGHKWQFCPLKPRNCVPSSLARVFYPKFANFSSKTDILQCFIEISHLFFVISSEQNELWGCAWSRIEDNFIQLFNLDSILKISERFKQIESITWNAKLQKWWKVHWFAGISLLLLQIHCLYLNYYKLDRIIFHSRPSAAL